MYRNRITVKEVRKRLNIEVPRYLFDSFYYIIKERNMAIADGIREAMHMWINDVIKKEMIEGFKANAEENIALMEKFKYVDMENWD